ncbi:MAG: cyclic nucleotide-binding domain-containing protein, partial [Chitinispirillaceae bacterium]
MPAKEVQIFETFRSASLFSELSDEKIGTLAEHAEVRELRLGEVLFEEDSEISSFLLVYSGSVRFKKKVSGKVITTSKHKAGSFFGEIAFLRNAKWEHTVAASSKSIVLLLDTNDPVIKEITDEIRNTIAHSEFRKKLRSLLTAKEID